MKIRVVCCGDRPLLIECNAHVAWCQDPSGLADGGSLRVVDVEADALTEATTIGDVIDADQLRRVANDIAGYAQLVADARTILARLINKSPTAYENLIKSLRAFIGKASTFGKYFATSDGVDDVTIGRPRDLWFLKAVPASASGGDLELRPPAPARKDDESRPRSTKIIDDIETAHRHTHPADDDEEEDEKPSASVADEEEQEEEEEKEEKEEEEEEEEDLAAADADGEDDRLSPRQRSLRDEIIAKIRDAEERAKTEGGDLPEMKGGESPTYEEFKPYVKKALLGFAAGILPDVYDNDKFHWGWLQTQRLLPRLGIEIKERTAGSVRHRDAVFQSKGKPGFIVFAHDKDLMPFFVDESGRVSVASPNWIPDDLRRAAKDLSYIQGDEVVADVKKYVVGDRTAENVRKNFRRWISGQDPVKSREEE